MKQFSSDKLSLAWFKLEEFITRGEKERALSIYRLLMHSVSDEAVKAQLEGDILHAFNDENAIRSYIKAATLYQKEDKLIQAVALYEWINDIAPHVYDHGKAMLELYERLSYTTKMCAAAQHLIGILIRRAHYSQAHDLVRDLKVTSFEKAPLHAQLAVGMLSAGTNLDRDLLMMHITAALDGFMSKNGAQSADITQFIAKLAALDEQAHARALKHLSA